MVECLSSVSKTWIQFNGEARENVGQDPSHCAVIAHHFSDYAVALSARSDEHLPTLRTLVANGQTNAAAIAPLIAILFGSSVCLITRGADFYVSAPAVPFFCCHYRVLGTPFLKCAESFVILTYPLLFTPSI